MFSRARRGPAAFWLPLAACTLLSLPYLLAARSFFVSDDWVYLTYYGAIPPWQVWRYFSPHVIWFYRPLQALQFGWLYHTVGLHPLAFNLSLWVMHVGVCWLVYVLATELTTQRAAMLTAALFAIAWSYVDVPLWSSNFSTLHWALVTLGLCIIFLRYLKSRRPALLIGTYALFLLNFCAKETAVNSPLLLAALWWWQTGGRAEPDDGRARLRDAFCLLGPFVGITLAYACLHDRLFLNVYHGAPMPEYRFAGPARALRDLLFTYNHLLIQFYLDPVVLPQLPLLQAGVRYFVLHVLILPLVLGAIAWRWRDRETVLGLLWILAALLPTVCLVGFHASRFYYLPAVGAALVLAHLGRQCWKRTSAPASPLRPLRLVLPVALAYLALTNISLVTLLCFHMRQEAGWAQSAFEVLQQEEPRLPHGVMVLMRHTPRTAFLNGIGVLEMVRLALRDPTALAGVEGQKLPDQWPQRLRERHAVYTLDFAEYPMTLRCLRDRHPSSQVSLGPPISCRHVTRSPSDSALSRRIVGRGTDARDASAYRSSPGA
jgi:hypothetical protein